MTIAEESLAMHAEKRGKIEVVSTVETKTRKDLSLAYTPGVAQPCLEIQKDVDKSYELTRRWNLCLVVTDGSCGTRTGRHRAGSGHAGHGGQMRAVQEFRWCGCVSDLHQVQGCGRDRQTRFT